MIKFEDCQYVATKDNHRRGEIVLVVRAGAVVPHDLAKHTGVLRSLKSGTVKSLVLRETVSDCLIIPFTAVKEFAENNRDILQSGIHLGRDVSEELNITLPTEEQKSSSSWRKFFKDWV